MPGMIGQRMGVRLVTDETAPDGGQRDLVQAHQQARQDADTAIEAAKSCKDKHDPFALLGGIGFDQIVGFDPGADLIDLPGDIEGFADAVQDSLSIASFDQDLASQMEGRLGAGEAVLVTVNGGDFDGRVFAVVDGNGVAGYQAGEDYVIEFVAPVTPINPGSDCLEVTSEGEYNNQWLKFEIELPTTYSCSTCWWKVNYVYPGGATVSDTTTWRAYIVGNPIHLVQ